ncbi:PTS sugar transporter subunit IIC [Facklamia sp. DSM 111018]|uniref:PTS sugar transporter subunit IIC n=1 Tax=Facklamia lactis TaxID=2749967 RepID=A0ABS0LNP4_9LACT|nr:PTS sugar transporter subunit IIC [Facklamia lactis]MBG9979551.1 PTS sugar transporter subunit IIC [Facklamia lactis]MBG9985780.1 PTS sugar transporter subunit IIC [Facklamia lactis]
MDYSIIQIILVFLVTFIAAIDQFSLSESFYQPIIMGPIIGAILGNLEIGLVVGATYQLMTIGNMPVGGAQPPNAVMGGIMATVLAISINLEPGAAVGAAIPFAMLGQYGITILFTASTGFMKAFDKAAEDSNPSAIVRGNYMTMALLGLIFASIVMLFFIFGAQFGERVLAVVPQWIMDGLNAAGGMMKYVGFATLLRVMISKPLWGFYFLGFALAIIVGALETLGSSALLVLSLIGFAIALWDYQINTNIKRQTANLQLEGDSDGI